MRFRSLSWLLLSLLTAPAFAQEVPDVKTRIIADPEHVEDGHFWAGVEFTIPEGWHIYWQNPGDSGIPTSLEWKVPYGMSAGEIHWPVPERQVMGDLVNYGYDDHVVLPVPIKIGGAESLKGPVMVKADWLVCKDVCIPQSASLTYDLSKESSVEDVQSLKGAIFNVPEPFKGEAYIVADKTDVTIALAMKDPDDESAIFPIDDGWFKNKALPRVEDRDGWQLLHLPRGSADVADAFHAVVSTQSKGEDKLWQITAKRVEKLPDTIPPARPAFEAFGLALLLAFLGGLILNLMPCVLPVLALKAFSLAKKSDAPQGEALRMGLAYTAGVMLSFAIIGASLLALKAGGEAIGWGFQLQSPGFILALIIIVAMVAYNLMGLFELPVLLGGTGSHIAVRHNLLGSFATGALAVGLATPCTAPFMAPALGVALTLPYAQAMFIFLALGFGLALPYLLISISPAARRMLPKPGAWMQRFRELLAFPMMATVAWLLWVLSQQSGGMGLIQGFTILLLLAMALWGLKHNHAPFWRFFWWAMLVLALLWSLARPPQTQDTVVNTMPMKHERFTPALLKELRENKKPVFVDATAAWCLTCKVNERAALSNPRITRLFEEKGITFLVADWTNRDADITAWLANFNRSGVPLYVYYPADGNPKVLPQLLTPAIVENALTD